MIHNQSHWALTICMENPEITGRIQMERFIPGDIFQKKSNTFWVITFFPFLSKRPKLSVPFVWITSARLHVQRKRKLYRYFVNGTTQSRSCFRCQKKYQYYLTEIFQWNFLANCKRSLCSAPLILLIALGVLKVKGQDLWSWIFLQSRSQSFEPYYSPSVWVKVQRNVI